MDPITIVAGAVALLLGGGGAAYAIWASRAKQRALGGPRLTISTTPYALGEPVPCRVSSVVRSPIRVERVRFQLACFEAVTWKEVERRGGKKRVVTRAQTETVWSAEAVAPIGRELRAGERFEAEADLKLPEEGGPTFMSPHNSVGWQVAFVVDHAEGVIARGAHPLILEPRRRLPLAGERRK
jgi:hypothetical protein